MNAHATPSTPPVGAGLSASSTTPAAPSPTFTLISASGTDDSRPITGNYCEADIHNSGDVTTQDHFDFLAACFAGCARPVAIEQRQLF